LPNTVAKVATKQGICEVCPDPSPVVELFYHDRIWLCVGCRDAHLASKQVSVDRIMDDVRKYDTPTNMKPDVHLARTMPIIELRAMIEQDETIPADKKLSVFTQIGYERFLEKKKAIFDAQQKIAEDQDEARLWQVNLQEAVGKLRTEERAKYADLNISYAPTPITKKQKSTAPVRKPKTFSAKDRAAMNEAAKKYDVPAHGIQMLMQSHADWTYEQAAKHLLSMMNPE
jgi:hypothetical protein